MSTPPQMIELRDVHMQFELHPVAESGGMFLDRGSEAYLIDHGRTQVAREIAHRLQSLFDCLPRFGQFSAQFFRRRFTARHGDPVGRCREQLRDVVVQLTAERMPLFLLETQKFVRERAQCRGLRAIR